MIENPNPWPDQTVAGANNWYTQDGYSGGSYVNCADTNQPGVASVTKYLSDMKVKPNCDPNAYYLVNNFSPAYTGNGVYDTNALANFVPTLTPTAAPHQSAAVHSAAGRQASATSATRCRQKHVSWA